MTAFGQEPGAAEPAKNEDRKPFTFEGGNLSDFTQKLGRDYGTNVLAVLDVRGEQAYKFLIPKMKIGSSVAWSEVLKRYNSISTEGGGFLGQWIFTPMFPERQIPVAPPETLIFVPPKPAGGESGDLLVRAFPIRGMAEQVLRKMTEVIHSEARRIQEDTIQRGQDISQAEGRISVHEGSEVLIAVGGKTYVELVKTVVDAYMVNHPFMRPGVMPPRGQ